MNNAKPRKGSHMATFIVPLGMVLVGIAVLIMIVSAICDNARIKTVITKTHAHTHVPRVVTSLVIAVQFHELLKVMEHISIVHIVGALLVLAILVASKGANESELAS